jgi:hypothetical protein
MFPGRPVNSDYLVRATNARPGQMRPIIRVFFWSKYCRRFDTRTKNRSQPRYMSLCTMLHLFHAIFLPLLSLSLQVSAVSIPATPPEAQDKAKGWSKEAIFALLGVFTAIICFFIGLAWSRLRKRLNCCVKCTCANSQTTLMN